MQADKRLRLRVSPQVARIVASKVPRDLQLAAARGELQISPADQVTALLFLANSSDREIRRHALDTLRAIPATAVASVLADPGVPPEVLDFLARVRGDDRETILHLLSHPALNAATLARVATTADAAMLTRIYRHPLAAAPEVTAALAANPHGREGNAAGADSEGGGIAAAPIAAAGEDDVSFSAESEPEEERACTEEEGGEEEFNPSKYKMSLEMEVAEKIKYAMTGDKEWRTIFLKDPNKMVSSAALKNPRITEGEVLTLAKNKSTNDELIRLIVSNREWIKNFAIRKALVMHPKTPLPKALRFMDSLGLKDLKALGKSRNVSPALANNARRIVVAREKKR